MIEINYLEILIMLVKKKEDKESENGKVIADDEEQIQDRTNKTDHKILFLDNNIELVKRGTMYNARSDTVDMNFILRPILTITYGGVLSVPTWLLIRAKVNLCVKRLIEYLTRRLCFFKTREMSMKYSIEALMFRI